MTHAIRAHNSLTELESFFLFTPNLPRQTNYIALRYNLDPMIQSGPIDCESVIVRPDIWFTSILLPVLNRQALSMTLLGRLSKCVRPKSLKMECYLLVTYSYIISLTIFGEPSIIVLGFLFSLLFIPVRAGGLFKCLTPSFPRLSLGGATDSRGIGEEVECGTWHIEMRSRRRILHQCRRRHGEGGYAGR